jgi:plasmid stabilization system protein ParE
MSFAVEFTAGAKQDLLKIYRYIKAAGRPRRPKECINSYLKPATGCRKILIAATSNPNLKA